MFLVLLLSLYISVSQRSLSSVLRERQLSKADAKVRGFHQTAKCFLKKSFNFRLILTVVYISSANLTPFTLLYFIKEESKLMTQEREIKPDGKDENHTLMAKFKDRWQNLKEFEFQRKKTANWIRRISFPINFYGVIKPKSN